ncbi:MAG: hypothetical protein QOI63_1090 [Thermoplasmata archaeon]|jgi:Arc/MetJ-type ribon-helix-helix transcriptional regulator|nr:hypothetical protein [Thermoplasmata archaeon]
MDLTNPPAINRAKLPLTIAPGHVAWVHQNAGVAGRFGSYSHGIERAIARVLLEHDLLRERCRAEGVRFDAKVFAGVLREDLEATRPGAAGRPPKAEARSSTRERADATVAVDLVARARDELVDKGPFEAMNQVVEVGLRLLQAEAAGSPAHPNPEAAWSRYRQEAATLGITKRR